MTRLPPRMESGWWRQSVELSGFCVVFLLITILMCRIQERALIFCMHAKRALPHLQLFASMLLLRRASSSFRKISPSLFPVFLSLSPPSPLPCVSVKDGVFKTYTNPVIMLSSSLAYVIFSLSWLSCGLKQLLRCN